MLDRSPTARRTGERAEEWAIHDYQGFGPARVGEYTDVQIVSRLGRGIAEHGSAFAHWAAYVDPSALARLDDFEEAYLGEWRSVSEYADHVLDDLGYVDEIMRVVPDYLKPYVTIDSSAFGRDLVLGGDVYQSESDAGTVHLFDAHA